MNDTDGAPLRATCPGCGHSIEHGRLGAMFASSHGTRYVCHACNCKALRSRKARQQLDAAMRAAVGLGADVRVVDRLALAGGKLQ